MGKHYRDMEMEEQLWYSVPISEDLALAMDEAITQDGRVLAVSKSFIEAANVMVPSHMTGLFASIGDDANVYFQPIGAGRWWDAGGVIEMKPSEFALVATIECNEVGTFVARAFGASDFWTALAVEDALMEVLS